MHCQSAQEHLVNVWVYQADIVVAGDAVAQGAQAFVNPLDHDLIWQAVTHVQQLCTGHKPAASHRRRVR